MSYRQDNNAADLAHVDYRRVERALHHSTPHFSSVQEFAAFCRYAADKWQSPGITSVTGSFVELERLGTRVDTSLPPISAFEPRIVDHVATVRGVLRDAADHLPDFKMWRWGQHDVQGIPQKDLAEDEGIATSTMSDWIVEVRDRLAWVLARAGMMDKKHLGDA